VSGRRASKRALLVALEGIDGAGKSTLAQALTRALRRRGLSVALRHEPSDARLGALAQSVSRDDPWTGAVYFTVDRYIARPSLERALARFDVVITDRSFYSTLAYQGSALPPRERRRLTELERTATREPDRILLLEIGPHAALRRLGGRAHQRGPLEERRTLKRVARAYRTLAQSPRWRVLDAEASVPELVRAAVKHLDVPGRPRARSRGRGRR
jgi:dTMP kinase